jgi:RNA-directed DNA polymerase
MTHLSLEDVAKMINPKVRGWINYYGKFYKTELGKTITLKSRSLERWATRKYKKFRVPDLKKAHFK